MQHINWNKSDEIVCKTLNMFGVHISFGLDDTPEDDKIAEFVWSEIKKLYPDVTSCHNLIHDVISGGLLTFDTEKEAWDFYKIFEQELTDSSGIYACIYSPTKGCLTENT
jgi:hypothetical protein